jgi:nucleoside-diphosphate-sugar epimerase
MRVVVIGATGNLGTSVVRALAADAGVTQVVGVARTPPADDAGPVTWLAGDVTDPGRLTELVRGADAVVHLAWLIQPSRDLFRLWQVNVEGTANVAAAVRAAGVPVLVHASSVGAYSPGPSDVPVDESWPTHGVATSPYAREKAYAERLLDALEATAPDVRVVRLRPALLFKAEAADRIRRLFLGTLVPQRLVRPGRLPVLPEVPGLRAQALHTDDAADAFRRAVVDASARGAYNLAAEPVLDAATLAAWLGTTTVRVPLGPVRAAVRASWALRLHPVDAGWIDLAVRSPLLDCTRATTELGWVPQHSALAAVQDLLQGFHEARGGPTPALAAATGRQRLAELGSRQGATETAAGRSRGVTSG